VTDNRLAANGCTIDVANMALIDLSTAPAHRLSTRAGASRYEEMVVPFIAVSQPVYSRNSAELWCIWPRVTTEANPESDADCIRST